MSPVDGSDDDLSDLSAVVDALAESARSAVASYRGLAVTLVVDGMPVTITSMESESADPLGSVRPTEVTTSLGTPLAALVVGAVGWLVLLAATPGALVDLGADLAHATGVGPDRFRHDLDLHAGDRGSGVVGLDELSAVNQAVGVLAGAGRTVDEARAVLRARAEAAGRSLVEAATTVLTEVARDPPDAGSV